jgi:hypothetical protein
MATEQTQPNIEEARAAACRAVRHMTILMQLAGISISDDDFPEYEKAVAANSRYVNACAHWDGLKLEYLEAQENLDAAIAWVNKTAAKVHQVKANLLERAEVLPTTPAEFTYALAMVRATPLGKEAARSIFLDTLADNPELAEAWATHKTALAAAENDDATVAKLVAEGPAAHQAILDAIRALDEANVAAAQAGAEKLADTLAHLQPEDSKRATLPEAISLAVRLVGDCQQVKDAAAGPATDKA